MENKIQSKSYSLNELFGDRIFRVPNYQRGYSWGEKELTEFWEDLKNVKENAKHYMSTITFSPISIPSEASGLKTISESFHIVDGQQRFTTLLILLERIASLNNNLLEEIQNKFLFIKNKELIDFVPISIFGYEVDIPSNDFFRTNILNLEEYTSDETIYTRNLRFAQDFFITKLREFRADGGTVESVYKKIINNLRFNVFISEEFDSFVVFETMNNRGKSLSTLELLKNRLLHLIAESGDKDEIIQKNADSINNYWMNIYKYLGKNPVKQLNDEEFIDMHWRMYFKYDRTDEEPYKRFLLDEYFLLKKLNIAELSVNDIMKYAENLSHSVEIYYKIKFPETEIADIDERKWLIKLNKINDNNWLIPLIIASYFVNDAEKPRYLLFIEMEKLEFLRNINEKEIYSYNTEIYNKYAGGLIGRGHKTRGINARGSNNNYVSIDDVQKAFIEWSEYLIEKFDPVSFVNRYRIYNRKTKSWKKGWYSWGNIGYFLSEYDNFLSNDSSENIWPDNIKDSIEHIYPQSPKLGWENFKDFRDDENTSDNTSVTNSLGNLVLLSKPSNSAVSNDSYKEKIKFYSEDTESAKQIAENYAEWTPETIYTRGLKMLDFLQIRWGIKISSKDKKKFLMLENVISGDEIIEEDSNFETNFSKQEEINPDNEIDKIKRKIPKWFANKEQINSKILYAFIKIYEQNNGSVLLENLRKESNVENFDTNYIQMKTISPKNHGKIFEQIGENVILWKAVENIIWENYKTMKPI